jgi:uncharacterized membrane protein YbjE (DUF340 family)|tara:strand:+ start:411 stop:1307 length:897 start_codon:yes stop_codon:yes gene_type:complete
MIYYLLISVLPILFFLIVGYVIGVRQRNSLKLICIKSIGYLVWMLLISIGFEFGKILLDKRIGSSIIIEAFSYATVLSIFTYMFLYKKNTVNIDNKNRNTSDILKPIVECIIAVSMVCLGVFLYWIAPKDFSTSNISTVLLYVLIFLIGIDLTEVKITKITKLYFYIPIVSFIALIVSAFVFSFFVDKSVIRLLVYGSGFGWFSMSGSLVSQILGSKSGAFTLIVDLVREFYAIGLLYLFGRNQPQAAIGVCGATAMDSTLPFIKNNCKQENVQIAIFIGFILTILSPFFIVIFSFFV